MCFCCNSKIVQYLHTIRCTNAHKHTHGANGCVLKKFLYSFHMNYNDCEHLDKPHYDIAVCVCVKVPAKWSKPCVCVLRH